MDSNSQSGDSFYSANQSYFCSSHLGMFPFSPLSGSTLSSPLVSEFGSTESESEIDSQHVAELTKQMALFMFQDDDDLGHDFNDSLSWLTQEDEKVMSLKIHGGQKICQSRGNSESSSPLSPSSFLSNHKSSANGTDSVLSSKQDLIEDQIHNAKNGRKKKNRTNRKASRQIRVPNEPRNTSVGTGVFLPRQGVYDHEPSEKSGRRPSVVIPARVVQSLRLHFKVGASSLPSGAVSLIQNDWVVGDVVCGLEHGGDGGGIAANPARSPEKLLPQEWTY